MAFTTNKLNFGNTLYIDSSNNEVGIGEGNNDPVSLLEVRGPAGTGTSCAGVLTISTSETTVVDNDVLGQINFQSPKEGDGTDSILVSASIHAEAEDTFAADNNTTGLVFSTNTSAAATERMRIGGNGNVGVGVSDPDTKLEILSTSTQLKLSYDATNHSQTTTASTGTTTVATTGSGSTAADYILDIDGHIELDAADSAGILLKSAGTQYGSMLSSSSDLVISSTNGMNLNFNGGTTKNKINLTDDLADALNITQGGNSYIKFDTTNSSENIIVSRKINLKDSTGTLRIVIENSDSDNSSMTFHQGNLNMTSGTHIIMESTGELQHSSNLNINVEGDITLDANGGEITFTDNSSETGKIIFDLDNTNIKHQYDASNYITTSIASDATTTVATTGTGSATADYILDIDGRIELDSADTINNVILKQNGTDYGLFAGTSDNFKIQATRGQLIFDSLVVKQQFDADDYITTTIASTGATTVATTGSGSTAADYILDIDGHIELDAADSAGILLKSDTTLQDGDISLQANSADANDLQVIFQKSRHATDGSHTVVQDNDKLGSIEWYGSDGTDYAPAASIFSRVNGTPGDNDMPGELVFATTADGANAVTERMVITQAGNVGIGTSAPEAKLTVEGTIKLKEQADADSDTAAYGQLWVNTATPNELYFTNDAGNDIALTSGSLVYGNDITRVAKATFQNTGSANSFLKHAAFFTISWPANYMIYTTQYIITEAAIVMDTTTDDTILNIADDQGNAIVGTATSITIGNAPGASGSSILTDNTVRTKGSQYTRRAYFDLSNAVMTTSMDRTLTGVLYHDADGVNDGSGDGSGTSTGLSSVIIYVIIRGFRVSEPIV